MSSSEEGILNLYQNNYKVFTYKDIEFSNGSIIGESANEIKQTSSILDDNTIVAVIINLKLMNKATTGS